MKIPETIKIAGFVWDIKFDAMKTTEEDLYGCTHYGSQTIYLAPNLNKQKTEQTLLHEIMHAVFWQFGLTKVLKSDEEETIVNAASFGLYHVLKDNGFLK